MLVVEILDLHHPLIDVKEDLHLFPTL